MSEFKLFARWIILDQTGKKVLVLRKNLKQNIWPWCYFLPWWTTEFGEDSDQTLIREIKEETNLDVIRYEFVSNIKVILWDTHWLWCIYNCGVADLSALSNLELDKHSFLWFVPTNKISELPWFLWADIVKRCIDLINWNIKERD